MATRLMKWAVEGNDLTVEHTDVEEIQTFDMTDLFELYEDFTPIQQKIIINGVKQKLADSCAREKNIKLTGQERVDRMNKVYGNILDGNWNIKGEANTLKKKVTEAQETATAEELEILRKFNLIK